MAIDVELRKITAILGHLDGLSIGTQMRILNYVRERIFPGPALANCNPIPKEVLASNTEDPRCAEMPSLQG